MFGPNQLKPNTERRWSPYEMNGGVCASLAGKDFVVIGADTRLSRGYSILTREQTKCVQLTDKCVLASAGMHGDRNELHTILKLRLQEYKLEHGRDMEISAIAQMLSNTLYYRRFFPYYTFNLLCGVNSEGQGVVYGYDAIGSYKEDGAGQVGSAMEMISPMVDYITERQHDSKFPKKPVLTLDEARNTVKSVMNSATERDIETGDYLELITISAEDGVKIETLPLRKD